ncbi:MAG: hypothetical protein IJ416_09000 [Ruminiclostridium sp.]|nr:hypothetical protein [Ruminiclostridium sp.]
MNLENYKKEMSCYYPDRKFVENTLEAVKNNRRKSRVDKRQIMKTVGGFSLTAAVLCGAVIGGGAVRSLFDDIPPRETEYTQETVTEEAPVEEDLTNRITETEDQLLVTPLAYNPKYTIKADTPQGQVSMDDTTTISEILACGIPVATEYGNLGMRYACEIIRKYINGTAELDFIIANAQNGRTYYRYTLNNDPTAYPYGEWDTFQEKCYEHLGYLSITTTTDNGPLFALHSAEDQIYLGELLNTSVPIYIPTVYEQLKVSAYDKETGRQKLFSHLCEVGAISFIYDGNCRGAYRMNRFIDFVEGGKECAAVQFTDISGGNDYDERFYSIEYCGGVYSIFTMTDGINGVFDTQYFDGYTVSDNTVTFDNGTVSYTFPLSKTPEEDQKRYGDSAQTNDMYTTYHNTQAYYGLREFYDTLYVSELTENIKDYLVINEEYSGLGKYAFEVQNYISVEAGYYSNTAYLKFNDPRNGKYVINSIHVPYYAHEPKPEPYPDGKLYVRLSEKELLRTYPQNIKYSITDDKFHVDLIIYPID